MAIDGRLRLVSNGLNGGTTAQFLPAHSRVVALTPRLWVSTRIAALWLAFAWAGSSPLHAENAPDLLVYGGTPAGIAAAVTAARAGRSVVLVEPLPYVGGMMAGGLVATDLGYDGSIGGFAREFFDRIKAYYDGSEYAARAAGPLPEGGPFFEPRVARAQFEDLLKAAKVDVVSGTRIRAVELTGARISALSFENTAGRPTERYEPKLVIDASYEGDLMARAGVSYRVGRESRAEYDEFLAGMEVGPADYRGKGDHRLQAYNLRSTLTRTASLRVPIPKPERYTVPERYIDAVLRRGLTRMDELFPSIPAWGGVGGKYDPNIQDHVDANHAYAEGSWAERARIYNEVRDYWLSLWWGLQNDPRLPEEFRASAREWGLARDEFTDSGHVSPQIYVRVARRMLGRYLMTERDVTTRRDKHDSVAIGSYNLDSHVVTRTLAGGQLREDGHFIAGTLPYEIPYRALLPHEPVNLLVPVALSATHVAYGTIRMEPVFMMLGHAAGIAADLALPRNARFDAVDVAQLQARLREQGAQLDAPYWRPSVESALDLREPIAVGQTVRFKALSFTDGTVPVIDYAWNFDGSGEIQARSADVEVRFLTAKTHRVTLIGTDALGRQSYRHERDVVVGEAGPIDFEQTSHAPLRSGPWQRYEAPGEHIGLLGYAMHRHPGLEAGRASFNPRLAQPGRYRVALALPRPADSAVEVTVRITTATGIVDQVVRPRDHRGSPLAFVPVADVACDAGNKCVVEVLADGASGAVYASAVRWIWLGDAEQVVAVGSALPPAEVRAEHQAPAVPSRFCFIGFCW